MVAIVDFEAIPDWVHREGGACLISSDDWVEISELARLQLLLALSSIQVNLVLDDLGEKGVTTFLRDYAGRIFRDFMWSPTCN